MSDLSTEGWTDEELAELAAAEAAEAGTVAAADIDPAGTGTATVEAEGEVEHKRATPTYGVIEVADGFPVQEKAKRGGGGPSKKLMKLLQVLVDDEKLHGKAVKVVEFTTSNGAKSAIEDVMSGNRQVPDGVWVLKALRTNDAQGKRVSHLWAVYQGEGENSVTDATEGSKANAEAVEADLAGD